MGILSRIYTAAFSEKYLIYTNLGVAFLLSGAGDILDQKYEMYKNKRLKWSGRRTFNTAVAGACSGLVAHHWYRWLDGKFPAADLKTVLKKILMDEIFCSPVYIGVFILSLGLMEGKTIPEIREEVRTKILRIYQFDIMLWPPTQFINFYFLPHHFRVIYIYFISLIFLTYTSHVTHEE